MASRSLLHDIGMQRPKVIQFAAWQAERSETRGGSSIQRLWMSADFADPAAQIGLLAVNSRAQLGEEWDTVKRSLSESRYSKLCSSLTTYSSSLTMTSNSSCHHCSPASVAELTTY